MKFKREEGLTLIELLITIAVIAIVAAISIPVITNVIESSRTSSAESMQAQVDAFVDRYTDSGDLSYDPATQTFTGSVDLNADGSFSTDEVIETLTVDGGQFAVTEANGTYTVAGGGSAAPAAQVDLTGYTFGPIPGIWTTTLASQWSTANPVLVTHVRESNPAEYNYGFATLFDAAYMVDYVDEFYYSESNGVYTVSFEANYPHVANTLAHYGADPLSGPANTIAINWAGASGGSGK